MPPIFLIPLSASIQWTIPYHLTGDSPHECPMVSVRIWYNSSQTRARDERIADDGD